MIYLDKEQLEKMETEELIALDKQLKRELRILKIQIFALILGLIFSLCAIYEVTK